MLLFVNFGAILFLGLFIATVTFIFFLNQHSDFTHFIDFYNQIKDPFTRFLPNAIKNKINISYGIELPPRLIIWKDTLRLISEKTYFKLCK